MLTSGSAPQQKNSFAGYLKDGAAMNAVGRMNYDSMKKLNARAIDWMSCSIGRDPNASDAERFKKLSAQMVDSLGDLCAFSFSAEPNNKPPFVAEYFLQVKDADKFNKAVDEFAQLWAGSVFDEFYKKMGMKTAYTIKRGVDKYKGVTIDAAKFDMSFGDANAPEVKFANSMYGGGMNYRMAIVDGVFVCKISSDPNAIHALIDMVKAGPPPAVCSEMQKALALIPDADGKDMVFTYNYLRIFNMMKSSMPVPLPVNAVTKSNLVFGIKVNNGSAAVDMAVPKEHLSEIMTAFQAMMQQQNQQQQQPMAPQTNP
jgi:hypothetical protein